MPLDSKFNIIRATGTFSSELRIYTFKFKLQGSEFTGDRFVSFNTRILVIHEVQLEIQREMCERTSLRRELS